MFLTQWSYLILLTDTIPVVYEPGLTAIYSRGRHGGVNSIIVIITHQHHRVTESGGSHDHTYIHTHSWRAQA